MHKSISTQKKKLYRLVSPTLLGKSSSQDIIIQREYSYH